jgi:hypothetical protein
MGSKRHFEPDYAGVDKFWSVRSSKNSKNFRESSNMHCKIFRNIKFLWEFVFQDVGALLSSGSYYLALKITLLKAPVCMTYLCLYEFMSARIIFQHNQHSHRKKKQNKLTKKTSFTYSFYLFCMLFSYYIGIAIIWSIQMESSACWSG